MKFFLTLTLLAMVATFHLVATEESLCFKDMCGKGGTHVACTTNKIGAACPPDFKLVDMNSEVKDIILTLHNTLRNKIAGGDGYFEPASRMLTMEWSSELEALAVYNVMQCKGWHTCQNTPRFPSIGQNLFWRGFYGEPNHKESQTAAFEYWSGERVNCTMDSIRKFPAGKNFGHFTPLVNADNNKIGCAVSIYSVEGKAWTRYEVACNYAKNNVIGAPIYLEGKTASKCTTGTNPNYPNLCSINEII